MDNQLITMPIVAYDLNNPQTATYSSGGDAFVAGFDNTNSVIFSQHIGGSSKEIGFDIDVNNSTIVISGTTFSSNTSFLLKDYSSSNNDFFQDDYGGNGDAFITRMSRPPYSSYGWIHWSTYFGAEKLDNSFSVNLKDDGGVVLFGTTESRETGNYSTIPFPITNPTNTYIVSNLTTSTTGPLAPDTYVASFDAYCNHYWTTYFGSEADDLGYCSEIMIDNYGEEFLYIGGASAYVNSYLPIWNGLPTVVDPAGSLNTSLNRKYINANLATTSIMTWDGFIARFDLSTINVGIDNQVNESLALTVYPIPASTNITIELDNETFNKIKIYNSLGALIKSITLHNTHQTHIDIADLDQGVYYLMLSAKNDRIYTSIFIKTE